MKPDINNFIDIIRQKNGRLKIKHNITNEGNIYKLLRDFGFRKSKLDNDRIYFQRLDDNVKAVCLSDIKDAFRRFLEDGDFINLPSDVSNQDILQWYYSTLPIKENGLFDHYLEDTLTESEIHNLRLQTDPAYKHRCEISQLLSKLDELNFSKTIDYISSYKSNNPTLYYKRVSDTEFIVFIHWNANTIYADEFDCWLSIYSNEKHIGYEKPLDLKIIRLGFRLDRDFALISQYLN